MSVDELLGAIRAADAAGDDDAELAVATRLRVARSLETRARGRHQLVGLATTLGILFGCTVSWALATGHLATLWSQPPPMLAPEPPPPAPPPPKKQPGRRHPAKPAHPAQPSEAPETPELPELPDDVLDVPTDVPEVPEDRIASDVAAPPAPAAPELAPAPAVASVDPHPPPFSEAAPPEVAPVPRPAAPPRPPRPAPQVVEALYRRAHDLHFHGGDPAVALAAWNAYLAAEPAGRFSIDARYNRALVLIRLRRYAEARAALAPFARGQVRPEGYRQHEAEQLVERLAQYE